MGTRRIDVFVSKGGRDTIIGRAGDDIICAGAGDDTITAGAGNDRIIASRGSDDVSGGGGDDRLYGGGQPDRLEGGPGADSIDGGDALYPDFGFVENVVVYARAPAAVTVDVNTEPESSYAEPRGIATGGDGSDKLSRVGSVVGSPYDDVLRGDGYVNELYGRHGADRLLFEGSRLALITTGEEGVVSERGHDFIDGGETDRQASNFMYFARGAAKIDLAAGTAVVRGSGTDTLQNVFGVWGSGETDEIAGSDGRDVIHGDAGDDVIDAHGGDDYVTDDEGDDIISGGAGNDDVYSDSFLFNPQFGDRDEGRDTVSGGEGNDGLWGGGGADVLDGGPGHDLLNGWQMDYSTSTGGRDGADLLDGGPGDDVLYGAGGPDELNGGDGDDWAGFNRPVLADLGAGTATGEGSDVLLGIENLRGSEHDDVLIGDEGLNSLFGFGGDDSLDGADGTDTLDGGPASDTCINGETVRSCEA